MDRVNNLEKKLDHLTERVEVLEVKVGEGFKAVDEGFAEQRKYTEFAYARLDTKMGAGFSRLEAKIGTETTRLEGKMDVGFSRLERKLDQFIDTQSQTNALVERRLNARSQRRRRS